MKKFKDLKLGEILYILKIDLGSKMSVAEKKAKITGKSIDTGTGMITLFYIIPEEGETGVKLNPGEYVYDAVTGTKETAYFSDKDAVDEFIKEKCDDLQKMIQLYEKIYCSTWEDPVIEEPKKKKIDWKRGDTVFMPQFNQAGLFDGENSVVFYDGHKIPMSSLKDYLLRRATFEETTSFFNKCENYINTHSEHSRVMSAILSCDYVYDASKQVFEKI